MNKFIFTCFDHIFEEISTVKTLESSSELNVDLLNKVIYTEFQLSENEIEINDDFNIKVEGNNVCISRAISSSLS